MWTMAFRGALLSALVFPFTAASAQTSEEEFLQQVRDHGVQKIRKQVSEAAARHPERPSALYFDALLEPDGESARKKYQSVVDRAPQSRFGVMARLKLAKYYFAIGMYLTARDQFLACKEQFDETELAAQAAYFAARSLYAAGRPTPAAEEMRRVSREYPKTTAGELAAEDLKEWTTAAVLQPKLRSEAAAPQGRFTIQIGAFTEKVNAISQRDFLTKNGLPVEIREKEKGGRTFYLVWVGRFGSEEEARRFGESFRRQFKKAYQIVDLDQQP